jgi:UDP-N-acetylmuramoyl-L-alanyl-D-glutamate--2,6-diaminopimelate ligase
MSAEVRRPATLGGLVTRLRERGLLVAGASEGLISSTEAITAGVQHDSRLLQPGGIFVAINGARVNGADFAGDARARGAIAVLAEPAEAEVIERETEGRAESVIRVTHARRALAECAAWWEGDPSEELVVIGVTGTDGKTTTSTFLSTALTAAGLPAGLLSTAIARVGGVQRPTPMHQTTPEAPALQAQLAESLRAGDRAVVAETTSHGLALDRVAAIAYAAGIVTNFGSDHLDLHGTVDAYRAAKLQLISRVTGSRASRAAGLAPLAVIRRADPALAPFIAAAEAAGVRVVDFDVTEDGALLLNGERHAVTLRMPGRINALNAAAALSLVAAWGLPLAPAIAAVAAEPGPPGRSERVECGQPFPVIVDFAHNGPSLQAAIHVARSLAATGGRVLLVTGAAGERDTGRRSAIGRVCTEAERVWIADEDPRGESPDVIAAAITAAAEALIGEKAKRQLTVLHDRRAAIRAAIGEARPGDVVLLAGKGHERTIERSGGGEEWDEVRVATEVLTALGYPQQT